MSSCTKYFGRLAINCDVPVFPTDWKIQHLFDPSRQLLSRHSFSCDYETVGIQKWLYLKRKLPSYFTLSIYIANV